MMCRVCSVPVLTVCSILCSLVLPNTQPGQRFLVVPDNVNITQGESVTMRCQVENRVGEVQWVKSGLTLGYSPEITGFPRYSVVGNNSQGVFDLQITDVTLEDEGSYECQVQGPPPLRAEAILFVDVKPTRIEVLPVAAAKVAEELEVTCKVYDARPRAGVTWKRNGNTFNPTSSEETEETGSTTDLIITTAVMKFTPGSGDNQADFTCTAVHPTLTGEDNLEDTFTLDVLYPPNKPNIEIEGHTIGDPIRAGQSITLKCESYGGNPLASLDWYKNGEKIDTTYETHEQHKSLNALTFDVNEDDNNAKFKCEANSPGLSDPLTAELGLAVQFPPKKVKIKGPDTASINETVTFKCSSAKSNPESTLQWVVDGRSIEAPNVITHGNDGSSKTKSEINITITDHDRFKTVICYANNVALGERMPKTHKVTIEWPPNSLAISGFKAGDVFQEGSIQKILCTVMDGNPMPKLEWKRGSKKVEDQSEKTTKDKDGNPISVSSEMTITVSRKDNKQDYACIAKEDKDKGKDLVEEKITLSVNFLPETVDITQPEKLVEDQEANFTCTSKPSNPEVEIVWHYNDKIMPAGGSHTKPEKKYGGFITTSFLVLKLSTEHVDGHIKCEAKHNSTDRSVFDSIDLDVKYTPKFTTIPEPTVVEIGDETTITVEAKANPNVIDYKWKQNNGILVPGEGSTVHSRWSYDKNVLSLTNIMKSDAGKWIVTANNSIGATDAEIEVSVQYPPEIISVTDLVTSPINPGSPVEIKCKVDANPLNKDTIKWEKEGSEEDFINQTTFSGTESTLYLPNSNETFSGNYTCLANNKVPKDSPKEERKSTFVRIKHAPIFDTEAFESKVACDKDEKCTLVCQAIGTPDVTITWLRKGNNLKDDDKYNEETSQVNLITQNSMLEIKTVTSDDYDNYTCVASNGLGDARHDISLQVKGRPDPPVHFVAIAATSNSITFKWKLDFYGGFELSDIGYKIRQEKEGSDNLVYRDVPKGSTEFTVEDLPSSTAYNFSILAYNEAGESEYTTDTLQYSTTGADPVVKDESPPPPSSPPVEPKSYEQILVIIAAVGGLLLLCNLGLLYCYFKRKSGIFGGSSDSMTRSSILEMYFSSSYNDDTKSEDSRSFTSERSETLSDSDMTNRPRIETWDGLNAAPSQYPSPRYVPRREVISPDAGERYFDSSPRAQAISSPYQRREYPEYSPSPPPFPQDFRRRPWQGY